jgi:large subunit GTPase 1
MTADELHFSEQNAFLEWRRELARMEDSKHFIITPFERNLEVWRQLWRVVDACGLIIQILDARNPLLYYCEDLKTYMKELSAEKEMLLLINKADFLTEKQRESWVEYFNSIDMPFVFYSAKIS